jgi:hypothetical protein
LSSFSRGAAFTLGPRRSFRGLGGSLALLFHVVCVTDGSLVACSLAMGNVVVTF